MEMQRENAQKSLIAKHIISQRRSVLSADKEKRKKSTENTEMHRENAQKLLITKHIISQRRSVLSADKERKNY